MPEPHYVRFDALAIGERFRAGEYKRIYEKTAPFVARPGYPAERPANVFNVATNASTRQWRGARLPGNWLVELLAENAHAR